MKVWQYHRGEWTEIDDPVPMHNVSTWEDGMKSAGFELWHVLGVAEYWPNIEVWRRTKDTATSPLCKFFVWYSLSGDEAEDVWITDLPSLLQFVRENGPTIQTQTLIEYTTEFRSALEKAFQIWHEHPLDDICRICDPFEYSLRESERRRRREKKRQAEEAARKGDASVKHQ